MYQLGAQGNLRNLRNLTPLRVNLTFFYFSIKVFGNTSDWKILSLFEQILQSQGAILI